MVDEKKQFHNPKPKEINLDGAPKSVIKKEFGKRLQAKMIEKGWNQSELAKKSNFGRDNISSYIRGISIPGPLHLSAMARALNCETDELLPSRLMPNVESSNPALDVKDIGKGLAWLKINQAVDWDVAIEVMSLIKKSNK